MITEKTRIERFHNRYIPVPESGCWLWLGSQLDERGYGKMKLNGKSILAHRYSYELHKGPIPLNLTIDHLCHVKQCVNPDHLEAVTSGENLRRSNNPNMILMRSGKCRNGHQKTHENMQPINRACKICQNSYRSRKRQGLVIPKKFKVPR